MKIISSFCAALLIVASFASSALAATDQGKVNPLPAPYAAAPADETGHIKVADRFGAGLATGIIGTLIIGGIAKSKRHHGRHYRYRHHRSCSYWSRQCAHNWGYGGKNYYGCMHYHGCR